MAGPTNTAPADKDTPVAPFDVLSISSAHRRTLDAIFRHPTAHNLEWSDVVGLIGQIGEAHENANNACVFEVAGQRVSLHKPHTKDLTGSEVVDVRRFLQHAGVSPGQPSEGPATSIAIHPASQAPSLQAPSLQAPSLLVVVDHHGTKVFQFDVASDNTAEHVIRPHDPHHFLHHLVHKNQMRDRGQRSPEESAYYESIAQAVAPGGTIVLVGHGVGKSNAAHHLSDYLKAHHVETYRRIVRHVDADLSSVTVPQLLDVARSASVG